jgi:hypothetical protein
MRMLEAGGHKTAKYLRLEDQNRIMLETGEISLAGCLRLHCSKNPLKFQ